MKPPSRSAPLTPLKVYHRTFKLPEFLEALPELRASGVSIMYYLFPFADKITVEFRTYNPAATGRHNQRAWTSRNRGWAVVGPIIGRWVAALPAGAVRDYVLDTVTSVWRFVLVHRVKSDNTIPMHQTYDPDGRLLNDYFRELLAAAGLYQAAALEESEIAARSQP